MSATAFQWPEGKRAAISLSFDDARQTQLDYGMALLAEYGAHATFYVMCEAVEERLDDWKRVTAGGHEIGNHSYSHPCSQYYSFARANALEAYTIERLEADVMRAQSSLTHLFGTGPQTFAYPCGQSYVGRGTSARSYVPFIARNFLAGRGFQNGYYNLPDTCDRAHLCGFDFDNTAPLDLAPVLSSVCEEGGWLVLVGHEIARGERQTVQEDTLRAVCEFAQDPAHGIWLDTIANVAAHLAERRPDERLESTSP